MFDTLPSGVIVLGDDGKVQLHNQVAEDLLETPLASRPWFQVIEQAFEPQIDDGHEISLKNGKRVHVSTSAFTEGKATQLVMISDLTETRQWQDQLRHEDRLMALGKMVAALAHQIRTPLSAALLYASHLKRPNLAEEKKITFVDKIIQPLKSIERQIKDMLTFSSSGELLVKAFLTDELMSDLQKSLEGVLDDDVDITFLNRAESTTIYGHKESLMGALQNLVLNSVQACIKKPCIQVFFSLNNNEVSFSVKDNGKGLSDSLKQKVFDSFFTTRENGTGLGLAIVKVVVERHRGSIDILSEEGVGTEIILHLPLIDEGEINHG